MKVFRVTFIHKARVNPSAFNIQRFSGDVFAETGHEAIKIAEEIHLDSNDDYIFESLEMLSDDVQGDAN